MNETKSVSKFKGVYYNGLAGKNEGIPWGAQIFAGGAPRCLGFFETEILAAEAFDNAVFYFDAFRAKSDDYNFPDAYAAESPPAPSARVAKLLPILQAWKNGDAGKKWCLKKAYREFLQLFEAYGQDRIRTEKVDASLRTAYANWFECSR